MKSELNKTLKPLPFRQLLLSVFPVCPSGIHAKQLMKLYYNKVFLELAVTGPYAQGPRCMKFMTTELEKYTLLF
jgi:hypothetical protein